MIPPPSPPPPPTHTQEHVTSNMVDKEVSDSYKKSLEDKVWCMSLDQRAVGGGGRGWGGGGGEKTLVPCVQIKQKL